MWICEQCESENNDEVLNCYICGNSRSITPTPIITSADSRLKGSMIRHSGSADDEKKLAAPVTAPARTAKSTDMEDIPMPIVVESPKKEPLSKKRILLRISIAAINVGLIVYLGLLIYGGNNI